jgi:hypothetical protein
VGVWVALAPAEVFVHQLRNAILERVRWPRWGVVGLNDLFSLPFRVFWMVPLVAALVNHLRGDRRTSTWVERVYLGLALCWFLCVRLKDYIDAYHTPALSGSYDRIARDMIEIAIAVLLSLFMVRRYGTALGRWFFPDHPCSAGDRM